MNASSLARALGKSTQDIHDLVDSGLPCTGTGRRRAFDADAVRQWLEAREHDRRPRVAKTIDEVAAHCGISSRRVYTLRARGMPGSPGHYPLDDIDAWLKQQKSEVGDSQKYQARLMRIRAQRELIELRQLQRTLVNSKLPERVLARWITEAVIRLDQIADRVVASLPRKLPAKDREAARRLVAGEIDEARATLARGLDELAAELEQKPDDQATR